MDMKLDSRPKLFLSHLALEPDHAKFSTVGIGLLRRLRILRTGIALSGYAFYFCIQEI